MDRKSRMQTKRRPANLSLRLCGRSGNQDNQINRENEDFGALQPSMPIFASVHRPRQANVSAIKKDVHNSRNQSQKSAALVNNTQQCRSAFRPIQPNDSSHDLIFTIDRVTSENGNSSIRGRMLDVTSKQSWQGIPHQSFQSVQPMSVSAAQLSFSQKQQHQQQQQQHQQQQSLYQYERFASFVSGLQVPTANHIIQSNRLESHHILQQQNQQQHHGQQFESVDCRNIAGRQQFPQQNFNQISKTATNLLHDIYEKHLLSQTTFENVNILNRKVIKSSPMCITGNNVIFNEPITGPIIDESYNLNNKQFVREFRQPNNPPYINPPNIANHCNPPSSINSFQQPTGLIHQLPHNQQDSSQHLYETVDETPINNRDPVNSNSVSGVPTTSNRNVRKRLPGKAQRSNKNLAADKQNNSLNQRKFSSNGSDDNHLAVSHEHQNQIQIQQSQFNHHLSPSFSQSYNYQQRTKADGENQPKDKNVNVNGENISTEILHPLQSSSTLQSLPEVVIDKNCSNFTNVTVLDNDNEIMQNIRSAPLGSTGTSKIHEERVQLFVELPANEGTMEGVAKVQYRNNKIDLMLETAQAMAAAAYYARAAQKLAQGGSSKSRSTDMSNSSRNGGFCGALQRTPPAMPAGLARRLANKENYGIGRVKVMLRVSDNYNNEEVPHFMAVDKKKRQVTLTDPMTSTTLASASSQERAPMVSAPKMFAFDGLFTTDDQQHDVCASALSEVIPAVLEGSDGCLLSIGYPNSGQSRTMLGAISPSNELGAIPCAISWLYKGINERRQKSGARFSVRVSALGVSATKPDSSSKDLLAAHATDSDDSPGVYLRDDFLGGPTELRAPTAERAALFLDAALAGRPQSGLEPAMIFTLHVYQYSLSGKGGVAGGRSRLHLIDLGGCANRNGGLPLSGIGNILLAILSGQRHPPNKDHPLTPLLKDCLAPLTCHVTILAHVSHIQTHADALTTIQLASRIHRMRRRKHRFPISSDKALGANNAGHQSGGSSEGPDPSSSDLSADTVIYMGPCDDATDGEHPPVYLPSLSSGDNRCAMNKVLKGTHAEKPSKIPAKKCSNKPQSPVIAHRADSLKRSNVPSSSPTPPSLDLPVQPFSPVHSSSKLTTGNSRHNTASKGSSLSTPKGSPLRRTNVNNPEPPLRHISEEQWVDGPRVSRSKVAEARHLLREINHIKQCETWVDGPKSTPSKPLTVGNLPNNGPTGGYGFMDNHKKTMIRQWVENQSSHVFQSKSNSPNHQNQHQQLQQQLRTMTYHLTQFKKKTEDDQNSIESNVEMANPPESIHSSNANERNMIEDSVNNVEKSQQEDTRSEKSLNLSANAQSCQDVQNIQDEEDQDSGPSEVPPALPLIEPLGSREISHESLHRIISRHVSRESLSVNNQNVETIDCGLQVTEEEIARTMGCEHPLAALSHGNISVVSSFNIGDAFSDCAAGERTRNQFDQLARLREIFTSQLAMAEVIPPFRIGDIGSVYSEPAFRFNAGPGSVCSEPAYRPPSPRCHGCRQSLNASRHSSQTSLPSLNGIMTIAGMEQYASLRHPDGASDPNLQKSEKFVAEEEDEMNEKSELLTKGILSAGNDIDENPTATNLPVVSQSQLALLPLTTSEAYDSGHDSSTPRTSKHSGISRRAESGYHSVATVHDSDESSFTSAISKEHNRITMKKKKQDKSLCNWLRNPFTCTYPETEGEISDF